MTLVVLPLLLLLNFAIITVGYTPRRIPHVLTRNTLLRNEKAPNNQSNRELEDMLSQLELENMSELSPDSKSRLEESVRRNAPSDLEVRMRMMGITPLTIAGFTLAGIMLTLNAVLGNGWLGDLLGIGADSPSFEDVTVAPRMLPAPQPGDDRIVITTLQLNQPENLLK